ncbi:MULTISPECIES: hypothetical protein [unclassified Streptomyces]|uniref:hypothetical protein n=1 Tax=unclassified Streptomyces TaxID=2593676 RepID=UPI00036167D6|nr:MULTISPECIES: hypothetical protein [unclassified Streptomyces]
MATMNADGTERGRRPRPSLTARSGRAYGAIPPTALVLLGIVVLQESLHVSQWIAVLCVVAASAGAAREARPDV